jgi:hypothetical protein
VYAAAGMFDAVVVAVRGQVQDVFFGPGNANVQHVAALTPCGRIEGLVVNLQYCTTLSLVPTPTVITGGTD